MLQTLCLLLALAGPTMAQGASPLDGRWVLDRAASDDVQRFLEFALRPPSGPTGGGMGGGGGPPGGDMGAGTGGGAAAAPSGQNSTAVLLALLAGSDRLALLADDDLLLVSWMEGLPQPLLLGRRSWRVELPSGEHMRIRAWLEEPPGDGALVVRRKLGGVVLEEAFLPPTSTDELIVVVTAKAPALAMPLDFRRVYRRAVEGTP
ncbi:MAG: hypothetical protein ABIO70_23540 [Pseudomonadota bacterium]